MFGGRRKRTFSLLPLLALLAASITSAYAQNCTAYDITNGCKACANYSVAINVTSNTRICTNNSCIVVSNLTCIECQAATTLDVSTGNCTTLIPGCKRANGTQCLECYEPIYYRTGSNSCALNNLDYCWKANASLCSQCSDENLMAKSSCKVPDAACLLFDYETWHCEKCNTTQLLHSSGIFCYNEIANCLVYELSTTAACIQCKQPYYLSAGSCLQGFTGNVFLQVLNATNYLTGNSKATVTSCLNVNMEFNATANVCVAIASNCTNGTSVPYNCSKCVPTYFLDGNGTCRPCSDFANCLFCDRHNCKQCLSSFYLVVDLGFSSASQFFSSASATSGSSQCLPCSIYGCKACRNEFNSNNINHVRCDACLFGYRLFNFTCFYCPDGTYFNFTNKACDRCTDNCQICNADSTACEQCSPGYYWNGTVCVNISNYYLSLYSSTFSFELLNKSLPLSSTEIINDKILLIGSCKSKSNGYACLCNSTASTTYSSLCYPINSNLTTVTTTLAYLNTTLPLNSTNLTKALFVEHMLLWKMMSELPNFTLDYVPASGELLSIRQFANYLQIKTNYIRNHYQNAAAQVYAIASFALGSQYNVFSPYAPTLLAGPGYYFKYSPSTAQKDDSSFVTITQNGTPLQSSVVFMLFNSTVSSVKAITGTVYVFLSSLSSSNVTLKIKKIGFLESYQSYSVLVNSIAQPLTASSDSQGYLTITNVSTSSNASNSQFGYLVTAGNSSLSAELYSSSRIQNLIYRDSFIYILVIFALYFILVPLCFLVDLVDNKAFKRKLAKQDEGSSYQGIKHKTESDHAEGQGRAEGQGEGHRVQKIYINYKDFFPVYNIANTPKPKRILKLCLFIVNIQHSITFLSLIYFHLPAGQPLVAVLLAIPAYICTVIMGYLCGVTTLKLPNNTKYLINILTIVYWVIWVVVMADFTSNDYKPYVYTFVVIFFALDMLFDFLETLLMYFTIKQDTRQIRLFRALSKWLSFRGYYEFDEMAKDLADARDNQ